jgi:CubicO group peptidase (beta-lactamase class C family)
LLETVFDLASLTKVLVTVPLLLRLIERGHLDPDAPLSELLPEVKGLPLASATVWQLAGHTAGLEALSPLRFWKLPRETAMRRSLMAERFKTGIVYSDQGFIVLTYLLERLFEARIDTIANAELFAPLESRLTYHPDPLECAATEISQGDLLIGVVHDENTRAMDGVSGHAGLFGTVLDVAHYLQALIGGRIVNDNMLKLMRTEHARQHNDARGFGWVRRYDGWLGGEVAPASAMGHTGFTGTGCWFDFETAQINVLLTNRICPSRAVPTDIVTLRHAFNDAAWNASKKNIGAKKTAVDASRQRLITASR